MLFDRMPMLTRLAMLLALAAFAPPAMAQTKVDLQLILAVDAANKKMSEDAEMANMQMPFDGKRMFWGGFEQILDE